MAAAAKRLAFATLAVPSDTVGPFSFYLLFGILWNGVIVLL